MEDSGCNSLLYGRGVGRLGFRILYAVLCPPDLLGHSKNAELQAGAYLRRDGKCDGKICGKETVVYGGSVSDCFGSALLFVPSDSG